MLLVAGTDPIVERIRELLADEALEQVDDFSFTAAWEKRAHTLVRVESMPRAGVSPPEPASLATIVQAAEAPSVRRVIVVTSRDDTDGELRRLRRSGARYVIVRARAVVDAQALRGKRVLVPRELASAPFVTEADLARAAVDAIRDGVLMGVTIDVPASGLGALEAAGARPRVVAPWRARVGRWLHQEVLAAPGP
jgi:hypothetical protein